MKTNIKFASFCLLSVMLGVPATADAAGASANFQYTGRSVYALASTPGCESTYQIIQGFETSTHGSGGPPSFVSTAYLYWEQFDCNTQTGFYLYVNGSPTISSFQVATNSSSASLIATVPVWFCNYDTSNGYTESCFNTIASVDLNAQAVGAMTRYNNHNETSYPDGSHYGFRERGTGSEAQAAATVTIDLMPSLMTLTFGGDFEFATISRYALGTVTVTPP